MALYFHNQGSTNTPADAAEATGFSASFIHRAMERLVKARADGADSVYGKQRLGGGRKAVIKDLTETEKKDIVYAYHEMIMDREHVTLESLLFKMQTHAKYKHVPPMSRPTLAKVLRSCGIVYDVVALNKAELQMRPELVAWRLRFLQKVCEYRAEGFEIMYTDETWFHVNDRPRRAWIPEYLNENPQLLNTDKRLSTGPKMPGKGQRLILFDVISEKRGKIVSCFKVISGLKADGDYHKTLDSSRFLQLFKEMVLENADVKSRTVVCIDNARYHSERDKTSRIPLGPKNRVVAWCKANDVKYNGCLKNMQPILRQMQRERDAKEHCTYLLEQLCKEHHDRQRCAHSAPAAVPLLPQCD